MGAPLWLAFMSYTGALAYVSALPYVSALAYVSALPDKVSISKEDNERERDALQRFAQILSTLPLHDEKLEQHLRYFEYKKKDRSNSPRVRFPESA